MITTLFSRADNRLYFQLFSSKTKRWRDNIASVIGYTIDLHHRSVSFIRWPALLSPDKYSSIGYGVDLIWKKSHIGEISKSNKMGQSKGKLTRGKERNNSGGSEQRLIDLYWKLISRAWRSKALGIFPHRSIEILYLTNISWVRLNLHRYKLPKALTRKGWRAVVLARQQAWKSWLCFILAFNIDTHKCQQDKPGSFLRLDISSAEHVDQLLALQSFLSHYFSVAKRTGFNHFEQWIRSLNWPWYVICEKNDRVGGTCMKTDFLWNTIKLCQDRERFYVSINSKRGNWSATIALTIGDGGYLLSNDLDRQWGSFAYA